MIGPAHAPDGPAHAHQLLRMGRFSPAAQAFTKLLKRQPNHPELLRGQGLALAQLGDHAGAIRSMERAAKIRKGDAGLLVDLGQILVAAGRYEQAERTFDRALAIRPRDPGAVAAKVELLLLTGAYERGVAVIEEGLSKSPDDLRLALALGKLAPRMGAERRAADLLERWLDKPMPSPFAEIAVCFRLADQYDRLGEFDRAFAMYERANGLFPARFEPRAHDEAVRRMVSAWTPERIAALPTSAVSDELPVFIVGMPRSGTSLVEQILACHPSVHGGGELQIVPSACVRLAPPRGPYEAMIEDPAVLTQMVVDRYAREQVGELRKLGRGADRVTDKLPMNFLHLGLIAHLHPRAKIIHCVRDPMDTCLSCYFQWFQSGLAWSFRQEWVGAYYQSYRTVMDHWKRVLPETPVLEVRYRDLVSNQEAWSRQMVEFVGMEWDDACLRFHESKRVTATPSNEQVRRPMYRSSVGRHRRYAKHLGRLREALGLEG